MSETLSRRTTTRSASATACAAMLFMLGGCAPASRGDFCALYLPVYTAAGDTAQTRRQADMNNAVWLEMCGGSFRRGPQGGRKTPG